MNPRKKQILDVFGREPRSLDELAACVVKVISNKIPVLGFKWSVAYSNTVSNSHNHPFNGVCNFSRYDKSLPTSYPGYEGRVWIRLKNEPNGFGSSLFHDTLTYPGTGGFGSYNGPWSDIASFCYRNKVKDEPSIYSWDYKFFSSDFPDLNFIELFDIIKGNRTTHHEFLFEDEETKIKDNNLMNPAVQA